MRFAKIPNNFFYNQGERLEKIGGKQSFNIYTLITHLKNMANQAYITLNEINRVLKIDKNNSRARVKIIDSLKMLKDDKLIDYNTEIIENAKGNDFISISWINQYKSRTINGWIPQYENDFNYYIEVGEVGYLLMWIIRTHINNKTGTAFLSVRNMANILKISTKTIVDTITELEKIGCLKVIRHQDYYYNKEYDRMIKLNNNYEWKG